MHANPDNMQIHNKVTHLVGTIGTHLNIRIKKWKPSMDNHLMIGDQINIINMIIEKITIMGEDPPFIKDTHRTEGIGIEATNIRQGVIPKGPPHIGDSRITITNKDISIEPPNGEDPLHIGAIHLVPTEAPRMVTMTHRGDHLIEVHCRVSTSHPNPKDLGPINQHPRHMKYQHTIDTNYCMKKIKRICMEPPSFFRERMGRPQTRRNHQRKRGGRGGRRVQQQKKGNKIR